MAFCEGNATLLAAVGLLMDALRQRPARMSQEEEAMLPSGD
ncbi:MAG: hypothetical protein P8Z40_01375 [Chloroflexota bacterium]